MRNDLLQAMGLGNLDITYIIIGFLVLIIACFVWIILLNKKLSKLNERYSVFMKGKNAGSLEESILSLFEDNERLKEKSENNRKEIQVLFRKNAYAFQKYGIVKYDAFHEMGGQLSFVLCLLNEKDDGFIMNSVHSTDGSYSYTKVITNGKADVELGDEENKALQDALHYNLK